MSLHRQQKVFFAYVAPLSFSGQSAASELAIQELSERGWDCHRIPIHPLNRSFSNPIKRYGDFFINQVKTWLRFFPLLIGSKTILNINLGQSMGSFARIGFPYALLRLVRPKLPVVISLHGSVFMGWRSGMRELRVFRWFLDSAAIITVLGEKQKAKLVALKVPPEKIRVVPNTCELTTSAKSKVTQKHRSSGPIRLLHLSLLIESKGYPEYLDALELLAGEPLKRPIHAILCGPLSYTAYCTRFTDDRAKESWILDKINRINALGKGSVSVEWIRGARGEAKRLLFEAAHIFVFPSRFPVEAQPLVLLEALASGCAVVTSSVGEIPSTVNPRCARMLDEVSPKALASEILELAAAEEKREMMGQEGIALLQGAFSVNTYGDNWEKLLTELTH